MASLAALLSLLFSPVLAMPGPVTITVDATRISETPLLKPDAKHAWMSRGVFNPTAVRVGKKTVMLFRAEDSNHTSRIGYAESQDGQHFAIRAEPLLGPETAYEMGGGLEDPRLVVIEGTYYLTYTGYNLHDAQLCLATSKDLQHWHREGVILPAYKGRWSTGWTKSGAIVDRKIGNYWWMYYLGTKRDADGKDRDYMGLAQSPDLLHWTDATGEPVLARRPDAFDNRVMEPGPAPYWTPRGILLLYNGANEKLIYGPGWVLFDAAHPDRLIARATTQFLLPRLEWERTGTVPNVIFLEGATGDLDHLTGYYGAADRFVGASAIRIAVH